MRRYPAEVFVVMPCYGARRDHIKQADDPMTQPKRVSFDWQDPMFLEQQLSEEERVTRDLAGKCDMLIHQQETGAG